MTNDCFKSAERDRAGFVARDGLLFIIAQRHMANHFLQLGLVVPFPWREHILKMGDETDSK